MDVLLPPPLHVQLISAEPVKSYREVTETLNRCLNDDRLLPNLVGANTYQTRGHLARITDEVTFLNQLTQPPQSTRRQKSSEKSSKKKRKSQANIEENPTSTQSPQSRQQRTSKDSAPSRPKKRRTQPN